MNKIGILTSGGDCAGLNAVIKGAARMAASNGISACIIPGGYAGSIITQRPVHEQMIAFYESLGTCFGRRPETYRARYECVSGKPWSYL